MHAAQHAVSRAVLPAPPHAASQSRRKMLGFRASTHHACTRSFSIRTQRRCAQRARAQRGQQRTRAVITATPRANHVCDGCSFWRRCARSTAGPLLAARPGVLDGARQRWAAAWRGQNRPQSSNPSVPAHLCCCHLMGCAATLAGILRSYRRECTQIHQHLEVNPVWAGPVLSTEMGREAPVTQGFFLWAPLLHPPGLSRTVRATPPRRPPPPPARLGSLAAAHAAARPTPDTRCARAAASEADALARSRAC
jgi:hypothetical protein